MPTIKVKLNFFNPCLPHSPFRTPHSALWGRQDSFRPVGRNQNASSSVHNNGMNIRQFFNQRKALLGAENEYRRGQTIRVH